MFIIEKDIIEERPYVSCTPLIEEVLVLSDFFKKSF